MARIARTLIALVAALVVAAPSPAPAHQDADHPGVAAAITSAVRHADGHVTASGWAECPVGEDWGVGFHVFEDPNNPTRDAGMASLGAPVHKVVCDGLRHSWTATSESIYGGGVRTDGEKIWAVKMQSPSQGDFIHKDRNPQGTVIVGPGGGGLPGGGGGGGGPSDPGAADLSLVMTDLPDPTALGGPVVYSLRVANAGPATARAVLVTDTLPPDVAYVLATPSSGTCNRSGSTVSCSVGDLTRGATATVSIVVAATDNGTLTNTASVASASRDPLPSNNRDTEQTNVLP